MGFTADLAKVTALMTGAMAGVFAPIGGLIGYGLQSSQPLSESFQSAAAGAGVGVATALVIGTGTGVGGYVANKLADIFGMSADDSQRPLIAGMGAMSGGLGVVTAGVAALAAAPVTSVLAIGFAAAAAPTALGVIAWGGAKIISGVGNFLDRALGH